MSRFNTGNPLGSGSPLDLDDNAKNMDEAANSSADTFQDRLGKSRLTWTGIVKAGSGDPAIAVDAADRAVDAADRAESAESSVEQNAEQIAQDAAQQAVDNVVIAVDGAVDRAENAADRAEAASDAAFVNADVYPDVATGLAAVAVGEQFQVLTGSGLEYIRYQKDSETVATEVGRYPSPAAMIRGKDAEKLRFQQPNLLTQNQVDFDDLPFPQYGSVSATTYKGTPSLRLETDHSTGAVRADWHGISASLFPSGMVSAGITVEGLSAGDGGQAYIGLAFRNAAGQSITSNSQPFSPDSIDNTREFMITQQIPAGTATVDMRIYIQKPTGDMVRVGYFRAPIIADGASGEFRQPLDKTLEEFELNYFPYPDLRGDGATRYDATHAVEDMEDVLVMNSTGLTQVWYDLPATGVFYPGNTITASADVMGDVPGEGSFAGTSVDLNVLFLDSNGTPLGELPLSPDITVPNVWQRQTISRVIHEDTVIIRVRMVKRTAPTLGKFRRVTLISSSELSGIINLGERAYTQSVAMETVIEVSPSGSDEATGRPGSPVKTLSKAASLYGSNTRLIIRGGDYNDYIRVTPTVMSLDVVVPANERAMLIGGSQVTGWTKTPGHTRVWQAQLPTKPAENWLFQHGAPDPGSIITASDRLAIHGGELYAMPFACRLWPKSSISFVDSDIERGAWFWEDGILYAAIVGGGAVSAADIRVRSGGGASPFLGGTGVERVRVSGDLVSAYWYHGVTAQNLASFEFGSLHLVGNVTNGLETSETTEVRGSFLRTHGNNRDGYGATQTLSNPDSVQVRSNISIVWSTDNADDGGSYHQNCIGFSDNTVIERSGDRGLVAASGGHQIHHTGRVRDNAQIYEWRTYPGDSGFWSLSEDGGGLCVSGTPIAQDAGAGSQIDVSSFILERCWVPLAVWGDANNKITGSNVTLVDPRGPAYMDVSQGAVELVNSTTLWTGAPGDDPPKALTSDGGTVSAASGSPLIQ